jgi:signal peptidase I
LNISPDNGPSKNEHTEEEQAIQYVRPLPPLVVSRNRRPQIPLTITVPEQQETVQAASEEASPSSMVSVMAQPPQVLWISPLEQNFGTGVTSALNAAPQPTGAAEVIETISQSTDTRTGPNAGILTGKATGVVAALPTDVTAAVTPDAATASADTGVVADASLVAGTGVVADAASADIGAVADATTIDMPAKTAQPIAENEETTVTFPDANERDGRQEKKSKRRAKSGAKDKPDKGRSGGTKGRAKKRSKGRTQRLFLLALRDMLIAVALLVLLLQFFSPTIVRERSMEDTLQENNILYIARRAYWFGEPQYGDIVVFHVALPNDSGDGKILVKRIIGVPGDHLTISGGVVYRNDRPLNEAYVKGGVTPGDLNDLVVPEDSYFVLGDNREVSNDSRNADIGFVDKNQLRGKVAFRIFPLSEFQVF